MTGFADVRLSVACAAVMVDPMERRVLCFETAGSATEARTTGWSVFVETRTTRWSTATLTHAKAAARTTFILSETRTTRRSAATLTAAGRTAFTLSETRTARGSTATLTA